MTLTTIHSKVSPQMKIPVAEQNTVKSNNFETSKMTIELGQINMVAQIVREKIYTDKPMAPVREYGCNALDEHLKHNVGRMVEFTIDDAKSTFSVRDFGLGLSNNFVMKVYGMIGKTTKKDDATQTGGYGLGSKSGHAYGDQFTITSYYGGKKTVYIAMLEGEGVPIGVINKVSVTDTVEPTGVEISLPIKDGELPLFKDRMSTFLKGVRTDVVYNGEVHNERHTTVEGHRHIHHSASHVRMGDVIYKMDFPTQFTKNNIPITIDAPLTSLTFPPSRESIDNTPHNQKVINDIINEYMAIEDLKFKELLKTEKVNTLLKLATSTQTYRYLVTLNNYVKDGLTISTKTQLGYVMANNDILMSYMDQRDGYEVFKHDRDDNAKPKKMELSTIEMTNFFISKKRCGVPLSNEIVMHYGKDDLKYDKRCTEFSVIYEHKGNKEFITELRKVLECRDLDEDVYIKTNVTRAATKARRGKVEFSKLNKVEFGRIRNNDTDINSLVKSYPLFYSDWQDYSRRAKQPYYKLTKVQFEYLKSKGYKMVHMTNMNNTLKQMVYDKSTKLERFQYAKYRFIERSVVRKHFAKGVMFKQPRYKKSFDAFKDIDYDESTEYKKFIDILGRVSDNILPSWKVAAMKRLAGFNGATEHKEAMDIILHSK